MKNWYKNMVKGQKIFVWLVSAAFLGVYFIGLLPLAVLTYLELGERSHNSPAISSNKNEAKTIPNTSTSTNTKSFLLQRFFISFAWTTISFIVLVLLVSQDQLKDGILGSIILGLISGAIALAIPTNQKIIYVSVTLAISFILAIMLGVALST